MSDHWDFYFTLIEERPCSVFVDLGIVEEAPRIDLPRLLRVTLDLLAPTEDGFPDEEFEVLNSIEESLDAELFESHSAEAVGRVTGDGRRQFFFYAPPGEHAPIEASVTKALAGWPKYSASCDTRKDPEWKEYLDVLYPSDEEMQTMQNTHVLEALMENGDSLNTPRPVDHWAYFSSAESRAAFVAEVENLGFELLDEGEPDEPDAELRFGAQVSRVDDVDLESINSVTIELLRLALSHDGDYDGWETSVVTEDDESEEAHEVDD